MVRLFTYENYKVTIAPEALILKPFRVIWNRDKNPNKSKALQELSIVYFMVDPRSDYQFILDTEARLKEILIGLGIEHKWKMDRQVKEAMEFYESFKPISAGLLEDTRFAIDKLRAQLRSINLNERDDKNKPIWTLSTITQTIKQIPALIKELDEAEKALSKDIAQEEKARGSQEKAIFEDLDDV